MRKILLLTALFCLSASAQPDISFRQIFKQNPSRSDNHPPQGASSYGDLLFQFYDSAPSIGVFSISEGNTAPVLFSLYHANITSHKAQNFSRFSFVAT